MATGPGGHCAPRTTAKDYLSEQPFSKVGLIQQLDSSTGEGFTVAQATYAAHKVGLC